MRRGRARLAGDEGGAGRGGGRGGAGGGGVGWGPRLFATTADELSSILEARAVAASKAEGARTAVLTMLVIMAVILGLMLSSPSIRAGFADPTAQIIALAALGAMAYGYFFLNGMIGEALE